MTEEQIERRVERMIDTLDRDYLSTSMSEDTYRILYSKIDEWAWMQRYSNRLVTHGY